MKQFYSKRLAREHKTVQIMIALYCHDKHHPQNALCADCAALEAYAEKRLIRCVYGADKPACSQCTTHCYKKEMREKIRQVMRYAGPRMLLKYPYLAIMHVMDKFSRNGEK